jgi:TRAP-type C4-dicarboxylate transport system permease small subunit
LRKIDRAVGRVMVIISFLGILASGIILIATIVNVITRSFFNFALNGALEISTDMMIIVAFCALPAVTYFGGHIKVDLVVRKLPNLVQRICKCFNLLLTAGICGLGSWFVFVKAGATKTLGATGSSLHIPYYPFYYVISAMFLICALCAAYNMVSVIVRGDEIDEEAVMGKLPDSEAKIARKKIKRAES